MIIEKVAAVFFLIVGLSYLLNARVWVRFAKSLLSEPQRMLPVLWVTLPIGLIIIFVHNIWTGWSIIVTLIGWVLTIKSAFYLLFPQIVKVFSGLSDEALRRNVLGGGVFMTVLGALLVFRYVI
jgi:uncharacterized protein YjeT (DUF2065 family)